MCGICGRYNFNDNYNVDEKTIIKMCSKIKHRGPDDQGTFVLEKFGFGMRRLSIIDLQTGHQPIFNEDKTIAVVFNGEIYNYKKLKVELETLGHSFETNSDTETIVHGFEEFGETFVNKLNGEFAISIYNIKTKKLYLYRDRLGIKPLFYYFDGMKLVFSSELKSILTNEGIDKKIDNRGLDLYLSFGYISSPYTIFNKIKKLEPGYYLVFDENGFVKSEKYWDVTFNENSKKKEKALQEEFLELFSNSVKHRMQSDVPYGAFLSGGIDSSLIVAMMSKHTKEKIKTFSLGYNNDIYYNETNYAEIIAKRYSTDHKSILVDSKILTNYLDLFIDHFDEPFADYSAFPVYVISQYAKKDVSVILSGDGGDEIFSGYKRYYAELIAERMHRIPSFIRNGIIKNSFSFLVSFLPSSRFRDYLDFSIKKLNMLDNSELTRYYLSSTHNYFSPVDKTKLYKSPLQIIRNFSLEHFSKYWNDGISNDFLGKRQYLDIKTKLPDDMLVKVDRMSMACSLEVRVPFLDHRVVEFASKLPSDMRMNIFKMKRFLKNSSKNYLPSKIIKRHKHGFSSPIDKWFRSDLKKFALEAFNSNSGLSEYIDYSYINKLFEDHINRKANNGNKLFTLLSLQLWYNKYMND